MLHNIINDVTEKLVNYPQLRYKIDDETLVIEPNGEKGFTVTLHVEGGEYVVSFEAWHEAYFDKVDAIQTLMNGVQGLCRVTVYSAGDMDYKWVVEKNDIGPWEEMGRMVLPFFPYWKKKSQRVLQNDLLL